MNDITYQKVREISTVKDDVSFLQEWTEQNKNKFIDTMELIREEEPLEWAKLYFKAVEASTKKLNKPKSKIAETVNINTQINKLDAASEIQDTSWRERNEFTPHEEIK